MILLNIVALMQIYFCLQMMQRFFSHIKTDQNIKQLQCEVSSQFQKLDKYMATQIKCKQM